MIKCEYCSRRNEADAHMVDSKTRHAYSGVHEVIWHACKWNIVICGIEGHWWWPLEMRKIWFQFKLWCNQTLKCICSKLNWTWKSIFRSKLRLLVSKGSQLVHSRALDELHRLVVADFWVWSGEPRYLGWESEVDLRNGKWDENEEILSTTILELTSRNAKAMSWR